MKRFDQIGFIVCLIVAAVAIWQSAIIPMGRISKPGPGFLPFWVGVILALLSIALWIEASLRKPSSDQVKFLSGEGKWPYVISAGVALLGYAGLLETLGFRISTFLLLLFLFWFVGKQKWWGGSSRILFSDFFYPSDFPGRLEGPASHRSFPILRGKTLGLLG